MQPIPALALLRPANSAIKEDLVTAVVEAELGVLMITVHHGAALHAIDGRISAVPHELIEGKEPERNQYYDSETTELPPGYASNHCFYPIGSC
jgi:hypothetical protein